LFVAVVVLTPSGLDSSTNRRTPTGRPTFLLVHSQLTLRSIVPDVDGDLSSSDPTATTALADPSTKNVMRKKPSKKLSLLKDSVEENNPSLSSAFSDPKEVC
jgi:hypothetical protein